MLHILRYKVSPTKMPRFVNSVVQRNVVTGFASTDEIMTGDRFSESYSEVRLCGKLFLLLHEVVLVFETVFEMLFR